MTMEPVFAGVFGVAIGGDPLGARTVAGAALVLVAMYAVELSPTPPAAAALPHVE
jgi:drug/metabolite transporter (DMT)-like permease